MKAYKKV